MHQMYSNFQDLLIICYAQKENLRGWVDEVRRISPKLPIIAVFIAKNLRRPRMTNQEEEFYGKIAIDLNVLEFEMIARELKILRCIECTDLSQENINKIFVDAIQVFHMPSGTEFDFIKKF